MKNGRNERNGWKIKETNKKMEEMKEMNGRNEWKM